MTFRRVHLVLVLLIVFSTAVSGNVGILLERKTLVIIWS